MKRDAKRPMGRTHIRRKPAYPGLSGRGRQTGMSKWAWLIFLMLIAGAGVSALRLGPHYIDFRIVQSVADRLPADTHQKLSRAEILEHFQKQFRVESFYTPVREILQVERSREETVLNIAYEKREHLFFNIDVVLTFNDKRTFK